MNGTTLTTEEIRHIADLAMISLTDEEVAKYQKQLPSILEYVRKVDEIASDASGFTSHVDLTNIQREDETEESLTNDAVIQNRKNTSIKGSFVVSNVITSEGAE